MHHYTRMTGPAIEKQIAVMNEKAANASGMPGYERINNARKALLQKIKGMRPLRRSEYINLHGYQAWLDYAEQNGLPEDHKWADADFQGQNTQDQIADLMG